MANKPSTTIGIVLLTLPLVACDASVDSGDNNEFSPQANSSNSVTGSADSIAALDAAIYGVDIAIQPAGATQPAGDEPVKSTLIDSTVEISNASGFIAEPTLPIIISNTSDESAIVFEEDTAGNNESITTVSTHSSAGSSVSSAATATASSTGTASSYSSSTATSAHSSSMATSSHGSIDLTDFPIDLSGDSDLTSPVDSDREFCVQVGEIVEFGVAGRVYDLESGFSINNLTAYSTLHSPHQNVQVISHGDTGIWVTLTEMDIVDLTVQYENDINQVFISAINNGGSRPLLLKKRFHYDSCGFALYTSSECDYITSGPDQVSLNADGTSITTRGCDILENFDNVPVVEIE